MLYLLSYAHRALRTAYELGRMPCSGDHRTCSAVVLVTAGCGSYPWLTTCWAPSVLRASLSGPGGGTNTAAR